MTTQYATRRFIFADAIRHTTDRSSKELLGHQLSALASDYDYLEGRTRRFPPSELVEALEVAVANAKPNSELKEALDAVCLINVLPRRLLAFHRSPVVFLAVSNDDKYIISADEEDYFHILERATSHTMASVHTALRGTIVTVAMTDDGPIYVWKANATLTVVYASGRREKRMIMDHSRAIVSAAISPDGHMIVLAALDGEVSVWEWKSDDKPRRLIGNVQHVVALSVMPSGKSLLIGSDRGVSLWDLASGRELVEFYGLSSSVVALAATRDGNAVIATDGNRILKWELGSPDPVLSIQTTDIVRALAVSSKGHVIIAGGMDGISVWDLESGSQLPKPEPQVGPVSSLAPTSDGAEIVVGGLHGEVWLPPARVVTHGENWTRSTRRGSFWMLRLELATRGLSRQR
ncbi:MAG: hypothetical protein IPG72_06325 [Ardenticatenales bacterium]|nr:hypothetical protein [Ardenticatenales bacterium]